MAIYQCPICGYEYDEEKEGVKWSDLPEDWKCIICGAPKEVFIQKSSKSKQQEVFVQQKQDTGSEKTLEYPKEFAKSHSEFDEYMNLIHEMSKSGKTVIDGMSTKLPVISWKDILILGAGLAKFPLMEHEEVTLKTIIGKKAKKPMELASPVYISHMSFGALSKEAKISLAKGSAAVKTAICSGEGGILPEEFENAYKYIFEYVPNLYSVNDENLRKADAIEIKIGQGTKPGMGGHLPGDKVTEEIAKIRSKEVGKDIISPARFESIQSKDDLKSLISNLRKRSEGRPIGVKIAAGHIEQDLAFIAYANPDFITIDGRGGATGASPKVVKDSTSVPTIFALYRAKKYLMENNLEIDLVITGGLRISSDFAKAIAMGADAVAISSAAMMSIACQQYRVCQNGNCPMGVATQDNELRKRLKIDMSSKRLENYLNVCNHELKTFARLTGNHNIHDLSNDDLCTVNSEIANHTNISHV
ncbi:MAG: glutamate synthase-related protein [Clostridia bacterium]|nr:glutamate synthase-related protein [Clostridia bacterium]